ncbi:MULTISPECIES: PRC-barrel domain-containing protein [unclassified Aureimonas]|uniref:PRC-barrel domain-containing protein n=1 Tax=unclassified Aureimonas TaxID=2615206 RepID=UPI000A62145D|nr:MULTISPECIES: PRC-barrel domain-containing protein [unclassified Aureimonas]
MSSTLGQHEMASVEVSGDNIEASRVSGTSVYDIQGEKLGSIEDVVLGKRDGRVKYAILSFGGFLGIGEEHYPLPWETLKYDERQGGYVVGIPIEQLKGAPNYNRSARPAWDDPDYGRGIDDYYGMRPVL